MPRSRSRTPPSKRDRRRSRSRSRERRHRKKRSRSRSPRYRSPPRHRSRSISPRRRSPVRSPSHKRSRERSREREKEPHRIEKIVLSDSEEIDESKMEGLDEEQMAMMKLMGFATFDSTKGKKVEGNELSAVNLQRKRRYRQYMNRRGGFNRPLDFVA
ncbi:unnamed protein product [Candidula unifasciata]|uniref:U4/U6.U5 small nuclear ribonucleoprotein 27 kDa protein n=1 Tax=Candidula unifasciata TaxID=100452 RepID=A0A8S3YJ25_9EUPU|nr:unnamed protein product [Candidula unifasciata]